MRDDWSRVRVRVLIFLEVVVNLGIEVTRFLAHATVEVVLEVVPRPPLVGDGHDRPSRRHKM